MRRDVVISLFVLQADYFSPPLPSLMQTSAEKARLEPRFGLVCRAGADMLHAIHGKPVVLSSMLMDMAASHAYLPLPTASVQLATAVGHLGLTMPPKFRQ